MKKRYNESELRWALELKKFKLPKKKLYTRRDLPQTILTNKVNQFNQEFKDSQRKFLFIIIYSYLCF
jgi:hypothetical protein